MPTIRIPAILRNLTLHDETVLTASMVAFIQGALFFGCCIFPGFADIFLCKGHVMATLWKPVNQGGNARGLYSLYSKAMLLIPLP